MGKLHRIRKAFNKLPDEKKRRLAERKVFSSFIGGLYIKRASGCYVGREVRFHGYTDSHRNYVRKLCRDYLEEVALRD